MENLRGIAKSKTFIAAKPLLEVRNFSLTIRADKNDRYRPLEDVAFNIYAGETVGLLGESGAGKTTLAMAILRLLPAASCTLDGSIDFDGVPLLRVPERELAKIRGSRMSLVYQDSSILNPVMRVGEQIVEVLRAHLPWTKQQCIDKAISLLQEVEMQDAKRVYTAFPHQLSGGQRQRIALAQALACQPALVIADEPTASLDPKTTSEILLLLDRLKRRFQTAFLVISHDYAILTELADRIMVMYAGRIVEQGPRREVLQTPLHPYTSALFRCGLPAQKQNDPQAGKSRVPTIWGRPPDPGGEPGGCDFENRCPDRMSICRRQVPEEVHASKAHTVRCFKFGN